MAEINLPKQTLGKKRSGSGENHPAETAADPPRLTPDELQEAGEALFGKHWQSPLAAALGLRDTSRIRELLRGNRQIPLGFRCEVIVLLRDSAKRANEVADKLESSRAPALPGLGPLVTPADAADQLAGTAEGTRQPH